MAKTAVAVPPPRKNKPVAGAATLEDVRAEALALPHTLERASRGGPAFYAKKKLFAWFLKDGCSVGLKVPLPLRKSLVKQDPETFFVLPQDRAAAKVVVRLGSVTPLKIRELVARAWRTAVSGAQ